MLKNLLYFGTIGITFGAFFYLGYLFGCNKSYVIFNKQLNNLITEYEDYRIKAEKKAQKITTEYQIAQDEIQVLYEKNLSLINSINDTRVQQQYKNNTNERLQGNNRTPSPIKCTCPATISKEVARDITKLARDADKAAEYAIKCHE